MPFAVYDVDEKVVAVAPSQARADTLVKTGQTVEETANINVQPGYYRQSAGVYSRTPSAAVDKESQHAGLKMRIHRAAVILDHGLNFNWPELFGASGATPDKSAINETKDWGRAWVGEAWWALGEAFAGRTVEYTIGSTNYSGYEAVAKFVDLMVAELPNEDHIFVWYYAHTAVWAPYIAAYQIWTTAADGSGAALIKTLTEAEWLDRTTTQFTAARRG